MSKGSNVPKDKDGYSIGFSCNNTYLEYELIDVDSDGANEILYKTSTHAQGGYENQDVNIVRYNGKEFKEIFTKGLFLKEPCPHPYCYDNSYEFVKNESNPDLYDIIFHINTQNDQEFLEFEGQYNVIVDEPQKGDIVYFFNGDEYSEIEKSDTDLKVEENKVALVIGERAQEVLSVLKDKDYVKLAEYVHPEKGVRFTPYSYVDLDSDIVLSKEQVKNGLININIYRWGFFAGSGFPIEFTIDEYHDRFVYDYDFMKADSVGYNRFIGKGNTINNALEVYSKSLIVEYYTSGTEEYNGVDWKSLRLVFEQKDGGWYLVGIIHAQWTI
ncbi:MAG: hypothetical protein PHD60_07945, partial [Clostridia bacterium]|nr:hypothetical protein [Clostridia bacterium]